MSENFFRKCAWLAFVGLAIPAMMNSCKDYDGQLDEIQGELNDLKAKLLNVNDAVGTLTDEINSGAVISNVSQNEDGITITLSNGKVYSLKNGEDGKDGANGKDADVWTIGNDGYWYLNGSQTSYKALGSTGEGGGYYYPDQDGFFWQVLPNGQKLKTDIKWMPELTASNNGMSVVYAGNYLTLSWEADGVTQTARIDNGIALASLEFVPSVLNSSAKYPTTDTVFYYVDGNLTIPATATQYTAWNSSNTFNKSNIRTLEYRISPSDANGSYLENLYGTFVNRDVSERPTTRAEGDMYNLMNVQSQRVDNGILYVHSTYNRCVNETTGQQSTWISNFDHETWTSDKYDFVAYQLNVNDDPDNATTTFTTDYIAPDPLPVAPRIVYPTRVNNQLVHYYDIAAAVDVKKEEALAKANVTAQSFPYNNLNSYLWDIVGPTGTTTDAVAYPSNLELYWNSQTGLDISKYVRLFGYAYRGIYTAPGYTFTQNGQTFGPHTIPYWNYVNENNWMGPEGTTQTGTLNFYGIRYEYSMPEYYQADDIQGTNQQYFAELNGSVIKAKWATGTTGTQCIGRTPVVRVDAYMEDNKGVEKLVASSYIKIYITEEPVDDDDEPEPLPDLVIGPDTYMEGTFALTDQLYWELPETSKANTNMIGQYPWVNFNNQIYGNPLVGLTSSTFWDFYGNHKYEYYITVEARLRNGQIRRWRQLFNADQNYYMWPIANKPSNTTSTAIPGGLYVSVGEWTGNAQTTNIEFFADYNAMTQITYLGTTDDKWPVNKKDGNVVVDTNGYITTNTSTESNWEKTNSDPTTEIGGIYLVYITIPSNNVYDYPNVIIYDYFTNLNTFPGYEFNPNYYPFEYDGKNYVSTKGKVVNGRWALQMNTMEAFRMVNNENVFQYWNKYNYMLQDGSWVLNNKLNGYNIDNTPLTLTYKAGTTPDGKPETLKDNYALNPVLGQTSAQIIYVTPELDGQVLVAPLQYTPTFWNTETWPQYFDVLFRNPFKPGTKAQIGEADLYPNYIPGVQYVNMNKNIYILDEQDNWIIRYYNGQLQLSDIALNQYKLDPDLDNYDIKFSFNQDTEAYKTFVGNLTQGADDSVFGFNLPVVEAGNTYDAPGRGIVTYWNNGATTVQNYELEVIIEVTFQDVSIVRFTVPFNVWISGTPNYNPSLPANPTI